MIASPDTQNELSWPQEASFVCQGIRRRDSAKAGKRSSGASLSLAGALAPVATRWPRERNVSMRPAGVERWAYSAHPPEFSQ